MAQQNNVSDDSKPSYTFEMTDDMILFLGKNYLKDDKDCLSLAISSVSENFTKLYTSQRKMYSIRGAYYLTPTLWAEFYEQHISLQSECVISFDASHTYWLSSEILLNSIEQMGELEELCVQDTQLTLSHLARIFKACPKLVKLSFSLQEKNLERFKAVTDDVIEEVALLIRGFSKLMDLKIYCATFDSKCVESWLVTFGVLKWCRDCKHLLIEVCHNTEHYSPLVVKQLKPKDLRKTASEKIIKIAEKELYPHLGWMRSLMSLIILKHDYGNSHPDLVLRHFMSWLLKEGITRPWPNISRLWIENKTLPRRTVPKQFKHDRLLTSLMGKDVIKEQLSNGCHRALQHTCLAFADEILKAGDLPLLKYFRGSVTNAKWFQDFCKLHSALEEIHLDDTSKNAGIFNGDWQLLALKVLVYEVYSQPSERVEHPFVRLFEAFPNMCELYLNLNLAQEDSPNFFVNIGLQKLTSLTIENVSFPANYSIPAIGLWKLERLQLKGAFLPSSLLNHHKGPLKFVPNLRDLRLEWDAECILASELQFILKYCRESLPKLERLVLVNSSGDQHDDTSYSGLEMLLMSFVENTPHLVALCLVGFKIDPVIVNVISGRLTDEIIRPHRPSFWFHIAQKLPSTHDRSVPKIHFDEIVNPLDKFYAPPNFF